MTKSDLLVFVGSYPLCVQSQEMRNVVTEKERNTSSPSCLIKHVLPVIISKCTNSSAFFNLRSGFLELLTLTLQRVNEPLMRLWLWLVSGWVSPFVTASYDTSPTSSRVVSLFEFGSWCQDCVSGLVPFSTNLENLSLVIRGVIWVSHNDDSSYMLRISSSNPTVVVDSRVCYVSIWKEHRYAVS